MTDAARREPIPAESDPSTMLYVHYTTRTGAPAIVAMWAKANAITTARQCAGFVSESGQIVGAQPIDGHDYRPAPGLTPEQIAAATTPAPKKTRKPRAKKEVIPNA